MTYFSKRKAKEKGDKKGGRKEERDDVLVSTLVHSIYSPAYAHQGKRRRFSPLSHNTNTVPPRTHPV